MRVMASIHKYRLSATRTFLTQGLPAYRPSYEGFRNCYFIILSVNFAIHKYLPVSIQFGLKGRQVEMFDSALAPTPQEVLRKHLVSLGPLV